MRSISIKYIKPTAAEAAEEISLLCIQREKEEEEYHQRECARRRMEKICWRCVKEKPAHGILHFCDACAEFMKEQKCFGF